MDDIERKTAEQELVGYFEIINKAITRLEDRLEIPDGFFSELSKQDDWSLIVKVHALLESSLNELLMEYIDVPEMDEFLALTPMNGQSGKIGLAKKFGFLDSSDGKFIENIGAIRNRMAHNARNVDKSIEQVLKRFPDKGKSWCHSVASYS